MRENQRAALDELRKHGIAGEIRNTGNGHPKLIFEFGGRVRTVILSGSPRDPCVAAKKAVKDVRKITGGPR